MTKKLVQLIFKGLKKSIKLPKHLSDVGESGAVWATIVKNSLKFRFHFIYVTLCIFLCTIL